MTTKIKPQRIETNNVPAVGQIPSYVSPNEFGRVDQAGGSSLGSYVQAELSVSAGVGGVIPFDVISANNGLTFDIVGHQFTAPENGVYRISFTGVITSGNDVIFIGSFTIKNNGTIIQYAGAGGRTSYGNGLVAGSADIIINLTIGDVITFESLAPSGQAACSVLGGNSGAKVIIYK